MDNTIYHQLTKEMPKVARFGIIIALPIPPISPTIWIDDLPNRGIINYVDRQLFTCLTIQIDDYPNRWLFSYLHSPITNYVDRRIPTYSDPQLLAIQDIKQPTIPCRDTYLLVETDIYFLIVETAINFPIVERALIVEEAINWEDRTK